MDYMDWHSWEREVSFLDLPIGSFFKVCYSGKWSRVLYKKIPVTEEKGRQINAIFWDGGNYAPDHKPNQLISDNQLVQVE